jgi:toxin CcdB
MAQFDVHRSPGRNPAVPYVVVIQSKSLDHLPTRVVVPLARIEEFSRTTPQLTPTFNVAGAKVVLLAWQIQTVRAASLGPPVTSLADDASSSTIINAIDAVITRAYG